MTMPADDEVRLDVPMPPRMAEDGANHAIIGDKGAPERRAPTMLDELREELADDITDGLTVTYPVPGRPKYAVRYSLDIEGPQLQRWTKTARDKSLPGGVDAVRIGCTVLAQQCDAILRMHSDDVEDAEEIYGEDDEVLTFRHPEVLAMLGASRATEAVRKFYGLDGIVTRVSGDLVEAAGYGDELPDLDPTKRHSTAS